MQNDNSLTITVSILAVVVIVGALGSGLVALPKMELSSLWREKQTAIIEAPQPVRVKPVRKPAETTCNGVMHGGFCVLPTQDNTPTMAIP